MLASPAHQAWTAGAADTEDPDGNSVHLDKQFREPDATVRMSLERSFMPTITDQTEFSDQDPSQSQAGAGGSPQGESPAPPRSRRKRSSSGLREQLPDELIDELLAGARTESSSLGLVACSRG